jgi:Rieske Fe-S protein
LGNTVAQRHPKSRWTSWRTRTRDLAARARSTRVLVLFCWAAVPSAPHLCVMSTLCKHPGCSVPPPHKAIQQKRL